MGEWETIFTVYTQYTILPLHTACFGLTSQSIARPLLHLFHPTVERIEDRRSRKRIWLPSIVFLFPNAGTPLVVPCMWPSLVGLAPMISFLAVDVIGGIMEGDV